MEHSRESTLELKLGYFLDKELLSLNPIQSGFLTEFNKEISKRVTIDESKENRVEISITIPASWIIYWFFKQTSYTKLIIIRDRKNCVCILLKTLDPNTVDVYLKDEHDEETVTLFGDSYEEIRQSFLDFLYNESDYFYLPFDDFYVQNDLTLEKDGLIENHMLNYFKTTDITPNFYVYSEDIIYDDLRLFGKTSFCIILSVPTETQDRVKNILSIEIKEEQKLLSFINTVISKINTIDFLNKWITREQNATRVFLMKLESININSLDIVRLKFQGYYCYNWVYELVIVPHLQVFEAFQSGRWNKKDFTSYIKDNFSIERDSMEELVEEVKELLLGPLWIDSMSNEDVKKFMV